jgi:hypothetical protein
MAAIVIDFLAERQKQLWLMFEPAPQFYSRRERDAISAACLIASNAFHRSVARDPAVARRVLAEAATSVAAMYQEYPLGAISELAISLWVRSNDTRLSRHEAKIVTDVPFDIVALGVVES